MFKKTIAAVLCSAVVTGGLSSVCLCADDYTVLANYYDGMEKAQFNEDSYGWVKMSVAERISLSEGVLGGKIADFDSDGDYELLIVRLINSDDERIYVTANLEMYEIADGSVEKSASTEALTVICDYMDAGGTECIIKNNYIALQCAVQDNSFSDGATQEVRVYSYHNNSFETEVSVHFGGSHIQPDESNQKAFAEIGFDGIANYFGTSDNPYFTGETGLNIAAREPDADRSCEVLIANDNMSLSDHNSETIIKYGRMNVQVNDFSDIEYTAEEAGSEEITVLLNGEALSLSSPAVRDSVSGSVLVPIADIVDALGGTSSWDGESKTASISKDGIEIKLQIGSLSAYVNGAEKELLAAPVINNGKTMVPLRFVSETFDAEVDWNGSTNTVTIVCS